MIAQYIEEMERRYVVAHLMVYDCTSSGVPLVNNSACTSQVGDGVDE
jgi:hypothetical protein